MPPMVDSAPGTSHRETSGASFHKKLPNVFQSWALMVPRNSSLMKLAIISAGS